MPYSVYAIRVPGLYEAEVLVRDQEVSSRRQAIEQAMKQVLVKLTGDRNAAGRTALNPIIETAENYVQQYRYLEFPTEFIITNSVDVQLRIRIRFDESTLNNALRNLGIQVWGRERPSTLFWLALEDENSRRILRPDEDQAFFYEIDKRARSRGIVLIYPLFDLQDSSNLRASDIWGGFDYPVKNASKRYYPDVILTGRINSPVMGIWEGFWSVYIGENHQENYTTEGSYLEAVANEGIDAVADIIATRFAQGSMPELANTKLKVIDIVSLQHYAKVMDYLQTLSPVTDVEVIEVNQGSVEFNISAHGGKQAITQAINFGRILEPVGTNLNIYRLLP